MHLVKEKRRWFSIVSLSIFLTAQVPICFGQSAMPVHTHHFEGAGYVSGRVSGCHSHMDSPCFHQHISSPVQSAVNNTAAARVNSSFVHVANSRAFTPPHIDHMVGSYANRYSTANIPAGGRAFFNHQVDQLSNSQSSYRNNANMPAGGRAFFHQHIDNLSNSGSSRYNGASFTNNGRAFFNHHLDNLSGNAISNLNNAGVNSGGRGFFRQHLSHLFGGYGAVNSRPNSGLANEHYLANTSPRFNNFGHHDGTQIWSNLSVSHANSVPSLDLDLSSTNANMTAGYLVHNGSITINIGGTQLVVDANTKLTPAEYLAVRQMTMTGQQSLVLDTQGNATGGTVVINQRISQNLSNLVVPGNVTVIDLTRSGTLNLSGNITNSGNFYVASRNPLLESISLNANNIDILAGGNLSNIIPAGTLPWLTVSPNLANLNLAINAANNINNAGTISSAGSLTLTAGNSITNAPTSTTVSNGATTTPTIQAGHNINLVTGIGVVTNKGLISAAQGNINISSTNPAANIAINSTGGTFQALHGDINVRDASYTGTGNIDINGGNYLSQNLSLYSGSGEITGNVGQVTGTLNSVAREQHMVADTPLFRLGNICLTGDPLYANTGNIEIDGTINTAGNALAIIAGGNVVSGTGGNVANIVTGAGNVWIVAGAHITASSGSTTSPITNGAASLTSVTFQFDSANGGNIDFTPATAGTVISTTGGNVTLLANSNSSTSGNIWFPTSTISISTTNSSGGGGAVFVAAGGSGGTSLVGAISQGIRMGQIQTAGSATTATGNVQIITAAPTVTNGGGSATFTNPANSATTTATFGAGTATPTASLFVGNVITVGYGGSGASGGVAGGAGGSINIQSGGLLQTGNLLSYGGGGEGGYFYSTSTGGNGGNAGAITVISHNGDVIANGEVNASGGGGGGGQGSGGGSGGSRANILLSAPVGSVTSNDVFSYNGGAGGAGALVNAGGGGGSFGGGGGGSGVFDNGGDGGAGGGTGAASGGGGGVGAGVGNFAPGNGGGFNGGGTGGAGTTASGTAGSASPVLTYGAGRNGGTGGNSPGSGGVPSGSGSTQLAGGGGAGTDGDENGVSAGSGQTTGGTLTVNYFSSQTIGTRVVATTNLNQTVTLTSLDLTNAAVQTSINNLLTLQVSYISGTLTNLTIDSSISSNALTLSGLTAFNVPGGSTLTLTGFTSGSPTIGISLTGASTTTQAIVAGTTNFSNSNNATIAIVSNQAGPALLITGTLSADNQLTITAPSIRNNNVLSALVLNLTAAGSGNIDGSGVYTGTNSLALTSGSGTIGSSMNIATPNLTFNTSGNVSLINSVALTGNGVSTGATVTFTDTANAGMTINNSITASGVLSLVNTGTNSPISIGGALSGTTVVLTATGSGNLSGSSTVTGSTAVAMTAPTGTVNLGLATPRITVTQSTVGAGSVTLVDSVALTSNGTSTAGTGGFTFTDSAAGGININSAITSGGGITINATGTNASIATTTNGNLSADTDIALTANGGISLTTGLVSFNGKANLNANNPMTIANFGFVIAAGNISFSTATGPGNIAVQNNGNISTTLGIVGFNGGPTGSINITGAGTITGQEVNVGNLNPTTLAIQNPFVVVSPFTGTYTLGNISITQNAITGTLQVSGTLPPVPTPSGGGSTTITAAAGPTAQQLLFYQLSFLQLEQSLQQQASAILSAQIGTRIPTDFTPWTTYPQQPHLYPLQGNIALEKTADQNEILFAASEFNANELMALSQAGVVFGPASGNNFFDLEKGTVLFMPNSDIKVQTREGIVSLAKGSVARIVETGDDSAIFDLHDSAHPIKVLVNGKEFVLAPGKELLLTRNSTADFAELNPGNYLGYRNVRSTEIAGGIKAFVCDFSIEHAVVNVRVINNLFASNNPAHIKTARKIAKNAAILADLMP